MSLHRAYANQSPGSDAWDEARVSVARGVNHPGGRMGERVAGLGMFISEPLVSQEHGQAGLRLL